MNRAFLIATALLPAIATANVKKRARAPTVPGFTFSSSNPVVTYAPVWEVR